MSTFCFYLVLVSRAISVLVNENVKFSLTTILVLVFVNENNTTAQCQCLHHFIVIAAFSSHLPRQGALLKWPKLSECAVRNYSASCVHPSNIVTRKSCYYDNCNFITRMLFKGTY